MKWSVTTDEKQTIFVETIMGKKKEEKPKKKSGFSLDNYKTHQGERGSIEQWQEAVRQAFLLEPDATMESIEAKLTKLGYRKIVL